MNFFESWQRHYKPKLGEYDGYKREVEEQQKNQKSFPWNLNPNRSDRTNGPLKGDLLDPAKKVELFKSKRNGIIFANNLRDTRGVRNKQRNRKKRNWY